MPGIHRNEVLQWRPVSELKQTEHLDAMLLLCAMVVKSGTKYFEIVRALNAGGVVKIIEKGEPLRPADSVYDQICAWCHMPQGIDLSEEEEDSRPVVRSRLPPPMKPRAKIQIKPKLAVRR